MDDQPVPVEAVNEAGNAAFEVIGFLTILPFIPEGQFQTFIEESHLPDTLADGFEIVLGVAENRLIGEEDGRGAGARGFTDLFNLALGYAPFIFLLVKLSITPDLNFHPGGKGVDYRGAHPV